MVYFFILYNIISLSIFHSVEHLIISMLTISMHVSDLGRFRIRSRNQRTNLNPNPDLIPDSDSCVVESDLESESCRFESDSDS